MRRKVRPFSIHQKWLAVFGLWILLLSGAFSSFAGPPGILQAVRLRSLLEFKKGQLVRVQEEVQKLQSEAVALDRSRYTQEREIRRVLGYAATDELVFDFPSGDSY